ncbi:kinase family [Musa troglodytarum]|uniref:Kinase family n=1 Tax=Musa troglodytarum TaxID=320322 RepID=A0A9E7EK49_9LILI|nr:kinase family [Musa troglodytarum]URD78919.1 kinase family [Musa troglodytarum]
MAVLQAASEEKKGGAQCVMVGLQMDANGKELLDWAIHRVAERGDRIMAVHVCRDSDLRNTITTLSLITMLDEYLAAYEGACSLKQVVLVGRVARGNSIRKALVKEAKLCAATKVIVGVNKHSSIGASAPLAKYCAKKLPSATAVIAVQNGKIIFEKGATKPSPGEESKRRSLQNLLSPVTANSKDRTSKETPKSSNSGFGDGKEEDDSNHVTTEATPTSVTMLVRQLPEPRLGWPLLRRAAPGNTGEAKRADPARKMSVVQWVMTLPDRTLSSAQPSSRLTEELNTILSSGNLSCKWFAYEELLSSTKQFSSENLIGKGGSSRVYRGCLQNGHQVAIKLSKLSAEASKDFLLEVHIVTKLQHSRVVSLLGICVEETTLISVYNYFPNGSLEEKLHGDKVKHLLPWDKRFKVAVGTAEALSYLHHGCPRPVIHRDVKSSNILLDDEFEPQLSDFGLAMWAPTTSAYLTQSDVVGTFGYIAPEYFMYGRVSNKNDVYAYGVVLLELVTGRKRIDDGNPKGEESLVMWAARIIEGGDLMDLLDPDLDANYDRDQMRRMILAASLCITRVARLRPRIDKIRSLLQGEEDMETWISRQADSMADVVDCPDDEAYPASDIGSHQGPAALEAEDDASVTSLGQSHVGSWEEYLRGRWSRSSSFD